MLSLIIEKLPVLIECFARNYPRKSSVRTSIGLEIQKEVGKMPGKCLWVSVTLLHGRADWTEYRGGGAKGGELMRSQETRATVVKAAGDSNLKKIMRYSSVQHFSEPITMQVKGEKVIVRALKMLFLSCSHHWRTYPKVGNKRSARKGCKQRHNSRRKHMNFNFSFSHMHV